MSYLPLFLIIFQINLTHSYFSNINFILQLKFYNCKRTNCLVMLNNYKRLSMKKIFIIFIIYLTSCNINDENSDTSNVEYLNKTIQYKTISDVDPNLLSLDIYYNNDVHKKKPIVFYVHGGGWSIGNKEQQLENKINLFRSLDYIFISTNYRLSPFPFDTLNTNRIKYPIHNIDIADAIKWTFDNIEEYGGDKNKIVLLGHSAGAHLVALTGTNKKFLEQVGLSLQSIKGVAVIDTKGYNILEQVTNGTDQKMYINAFGKNYNENVNASPIFNINSTTTYPKFFIAKRGTAKRIGYVDDFIKKLQTNNIFVSQITANEYSHNEINKAIGKVDETIITSPLKTFFAECFK